MTARLAEVVARDPNPDPRPSPVSLGWADYSQVDMLGVRHKPVDFGVGEGPGSPNVLVQTDWYRARKR